MRRRMTLSLAAVFAALCLYYREGALLLPAVLLPVAAHELAHLLALRLLGLRIETLTLEPRGLCVHYRDGGRGELLAALAGPLGGAVYALAFWNARIPWLRDSAGLSLLLTAFNLLPVTPLDGGRVFSRLCARTLGEERGGRLAGAVSAVFLALLLIAGVALALRKKTTPPLAAALWLLLSRKDEETLVKRGEIR